MPKTIKQRLAEGELVRVISLGGLPSPKIIEIVGRLDWIHGVWIDQEHAAVTHEKLELLAIACRAAGLDAFARVAPTDYATIMRPMETGAGGVMAAQIRSVSQVEQVVQWAKYPPFGVRGLNMGNYEAGYGTANVAEHVERANRDGWLTIQIETVEALESVGKIAQVQGVDCLFVGPADLASNLGVPGQVTHPKCLEALARVSDAAQTAGKPWGVVAANSEHGEKCREMGCRLFSLASELALLHRGLDATQKMFQSLM